jgi:hypothetical protein|tara:strand:- start:1003 stop:1359 length:357 start_codon:yes stop_codon:yes gene_type:complete
MTNKDKHVVIIDHIGRTILGKQTEFDEETELTIDNPVILHCQPQENGQLEVQTFPLFFFEFIDKSAREHNSWTFQRSNIVVSNVVLNPDIIAQYAKINTPPPQTVVDDNPKVVSINDV